MADTAGAAARRENLSPATFLEAVADITEMLNKVTSAQSRYRTARKKWKGEGINLSMLDEVMKLKRMDEADVQADEKDRQKYATWLNIDMGFQAEFEFPQLSAAEDEMRAKNDAMQDGRAACRRGDKRTSNKFEPGTVAWAAFDTGWLAAEKEEFDGAAPATRQPSKGRGAESKGKAKNKNQTPAAAPADAATGEPAGAVEQPPADTQPEPPEDAGESALDIPAELVGVRRREDNA